MNCRRVRTTGLLLAAFGASLHAGPLTPQRISMNTTTLESGNAASDVPSLSSDGRYVAFESGANNLVTGYTPGVAQIYLYDRQNNTLELISVSTSGTAAADAGCTSPQVSADGRYVSFVSSADNIDTEGAGVQASTGLHIRDRQAGITFPPVVVWLGGAGSTYISDGKYARLLMNATGTRFGATLGSGVLNTELIDASGRLDTICPVDSESSHGSTAAQPCDNAVISADGSTIAFRTAYPSLVSGDTNGFVDAFVYNAASLQIVRASVNADGSQGNGDVDVASGFSFAGNLALSSNGNLLAFNSGNATNLGGSDLPTQLLLVKNLTTGEIEIAGTTTDDSGTPAPSQSNTYGPQFSSDARLLTYQSQTLGEQTDIRVRAMDTQQVRSICRGQSGNMANNGCRNVAISADGHWAAFASGSTDIARYPVAPTFVEQDVYLVNIDALFDDIFADGFEQ